MSKKSKKIPYIPAMLEIGEILEKIPPNNFVSLQLVEFRKGAHVNKMWLALKNKTGFDTTREVLSCDPYLSLTGDWMVKFENSCCAYLVSLCAPTV